ncbi:hypothetical protein BH20BAC1_BH20BAC1_00710 [soil metagenome]
MPDTLPAQTTTTVAAGTQYKRSGWHNFYWGKNYRKAWTQPVRLKNFYLDKEKGGLKIKDLGGGNQTRSIHLEAKDEKDYTLRSVDKTLGKVLPKEFLGTWIEDLVNDEVSMSFPYGAVTVPPMAKKAGIYYTKPGFVYLPKQRALDTLQRLENDVYLFEQRIKGSWEDAENLGYFDKFYSTDEVMEKIFDETENRVDQETYLKSRLFDMFVGDWDRHENQWEWGVRKDGDKKIFVPLPQDRDQIYSTHDGLLLGIAISASGMGYFQKFTDKVNDIEIFNYEERGTDRLFTNQLTKEDWLNIANNLKSAMTDETIMEGIKRLPPEIYSIYGEELISKLRSRREQIPEYAMKYYYFLAKEVEIIGTKGAEYFDITPLEHGNLSVKLFNKTKDGEKEETPFYSRIFGDETNEVRLFGLDDNDIYEVKGNTFSPVKIRIIGGEKKDSILLANNRIKTYIYDDHKNYIDKSGKTRLKLSDDSDIHKYQFRSFLYDKKGIKPSVFFSDADRLYIGLGYGWTHQKWRKFPYAFKQDVGINFSLMQGSLSFFYNGLFPEAIGKLNLAVNSMYDLVRWTNFYGLGNETPLTTKDRNFNRMRSKEFTGSLGLEKVFQHNKISLRGFFQTVKIINDEDRFTAKILALTDSTVFDQTNFAGSTLLYQLSLLNNDAVPTAGIQLNASATFTQNLEAKSNFWKYAGNVNLYIPLFSDFSLAIISGVATVTGNPLFYQYPEIGGGMNLRGFQRQRFYGKTTFYNSNELRFLPEIKSYLMNGKLGLVAFVDNGRVWLPGENSDTWHMGYGGGLLIAPFNKILADITYGISNEDNVIQFRFNISL